ncbi:MAG TPA: ATP-binding protein [Planctomycetota bacterium]|nr:ATP-binding protein [Planctomycetota bacterium]
MSKPIRVLVVEDSEDDHYLLLRELRRNDYAPESLRVEIPETMNAALNKEAWDIVISDYALPQFSAPAALKLVQDRGIDLPFIIMSGAVGEERAVAALKAGAHDFIPKGAMPRLVPAIERELREAESRRARRKAEAEVSDLYENAPCGYHSLDSDGIFVRINNTELSWLGYKREEIVGVKRFRDLVAPNSRKVYEDAFEAFKASGSVRDVEYNIVRKDGSIMPVLLNSSLIRDAQGRYVMSRSIVFDTSERKRLEEQLRHSQKLDAIGKFAGSVASDFNNMIALILKHSQGTLDSLKPGDAMSRPLTLINETGKKAAALTKLLLAFSRRQSVDAKVLDLYYIVAGMEAMLRRMLRENITIEMKLDSSGARVKANPEQIEQIVMILVENAGDAMPAGGTLRFETSRAALDENYCRTHSGVKPGAYAVLSISDTGCGIADPVMPFIFEPFFTTKEHGKGAGLGLSAVYGIVKQAGGCIDVFSEIGKGTAFKIYLPRVEDPAAPSVGAAH